MALLTEEQIAIRDTTRAFVAKEIIPFAAEWDRTATVPVDAVLRIGKLGHRSGETCQTLLEDLEMPAEDMLGKPGEGLRIAFAGLESGRVGVAARSTGTARAAYDAALAYARERAAFGKKIIEHQAVAFKSWPRWPRKSRWRVNCATTPPSCGRPVGAASSNRRL